MRVQPLLVSLLAVLLAFVLSGCATGSKFNTAGVDKSVTPGSPTGDILAVKGRRVQWGGTIIGTTNLKDATQIEVLGYPLEDNGRPEIDSAALRRFLVLYNGYLESVDYAPGRLLTAVGSIVEAREGKVGGTNYLYPVVAAEQLYLWPRERYYDYYREPTFHFGIGVGIGL
jgi:outer membrane lipoprotein